MTLSLASTRNYTLPPYFLGSLDCHADPEDDYTFVLNKELGFVDSKGERVFSPEGMRTDGVSVGQMFSIPFIGWLTYRVLQGNQFTGPFRLPAVIHDGEYGRACTRTIWEALVSPERAAADRRIREGARACYVFERIIAGVCECRNCLRIRDRQPASAWRAWVVWWLLRVAGAPAWQSDASKAQRSQEAIQQASLAAV